MNEEIKKLAHDILDAPDIIMTQTHKDLEAVSNIFWKHQKYIDSMLQAFKNKGLLFGEYDD